MIPERSWIPWFGLALVLLTASGPASILGVLPRDLFLALGGVGLAVSLYFGVRPRILSKYDLNELQRVHDRAEIEKLDVGSPEDVPVIHCLCGNIYNSRLPVCPVCKRSQ